MYNVYAVKDTFSLPPEYFGKNLELAAQDILQRKYEGYSDKDMGIILAIFNVRGISDGEIYPGDPGTHHEAEFDVLTYMPPFMLTVDILANTWSPFFMLSPFWREVNCWVFLSYERKSFAICET